MPLVYWQPGKIEGGVWCNTPVNCIDQLPTLATLTGNPVPEGVDGISIVPLLVNPAAEMATRTFFWHYPFNVQVRHPDNGLPLAPHSGIRVGDYKLIWDWHGKLELFNIPHDPYEANDLADNMPEMRDQLMKQLRSWLKNNVAPRYLPIRDADYRAEDDNRPYPFMDLTGELRLLENTQ